MEFLWNREIPRSNIGVPSNCTAASQVGSWTDQLGKLSRIKHDGYHWTKTSLTRQTQRMYVISLETTALSPQLRPVRTLTDNMASHTGA